MHILICDDIKSDTIKLDKLLKKIDSSIGVVCFNNTDDALNYIQRGVLVDLCFLDIIMPDMSGIALAREIRSTGYSGDIVFLTTSNSYAAQSYEINAFGYLLKPPAPAAVRDILNRLEDARALSDTQSIFVKASKVARRVRFCDISHVEVIKHFVYIHLTDGQSLEIRCTFSEIAGQLLRDDRFVQCHRSYIANLDEIAAIEDRVIATVSGGRIPVSKNYSDIKKAYAKWIVGGERV